MNNDLYIELMAYENMLFTATERNYVIFGTLENKRKLNELYTKVFNKKSGIMGGCGGCALREMKELGKAYFNYKNTVRKELEPKEDNPTVTEEVKEVKKNKKSQKRNE